MNKLEAGKESNSWLRQDTARIDSYLNIADLVLVERERTIKILTDLFTYHFDGQKNLCLLDLGCGDGILTKNIREKHPQNTFHLMDASTKMIENARNNLGDKPGKGTYSYINKTFEDYINLHDETRYDFIYSANAIHHLDMEGKKKLYLKIYQQLKPWGLFVNIDVVQPSSKRCEEWQFKMWTDWINETLRQKGFEQKIGKYDDIPSAYKAAKENKPSPLNEQLETISTIGFKDVECHYRYGIFTIFSGTK